MLGYSQEMLYLYIEFRIFARMIVRGENVKSVAEGASSEEL